MPIPNVFILGRGNSIAIGNLLAETDQVLRKIQPQDVDEAERLARTLENLAMVRGDVFDGACTSLDRYHVIHVIHYGGENRRIDLRKELANYSFWTWIATDLENSAAARQVRTALNTLRIYL